MITLSTIFILSNQKGILSVLWRYFYLPYAVLSRSLCVDLSMTGDEKIQRMSHVLRDILPDLDIKYKQDALAFLSEKKDNDSVNLRSLIMVSKIRKEFPRKWKGISEYMMEG